MTMLEKDKSWAQKKKTPRRPQREDLDKKGRVALNLLSQGKISKAVRMINSNGVARIEDEGVLEQLMANYPDRKRELPTSVQKGQCVKIFVA